MVHKHLFSRNNTYYFRWRIPSDLHSEFGLLEIKRSLHTAEQSEAYARACRLLEQVSIIKKARNALRHHEINIQEYLGVVQKMAGETILTNKITDTSGDMAYTPMREKNSAETTDVKLASTEQSCEKPQILMSELFNKFIEHKILVSRLSLLMQNSYRLYIKTLIDIIGDMQVVDIKKNDIRDALMDYKRLPRRNLRKYKSIPVSELLEMMVPEEDCLSGKSVDSVRKFLQGLFNYAVRQEILESSPATGLKLDFNVAITYAKFDDSEVHKILTEVSKQSQIWRKWSCWLAAYTGARRSEIVQLRKEDIKIDEKTGRHYILITDKAGSVKTESAIRQVPIHQKLIDEGFLDYVKASQELKIFPTLDPETLTKWFPVFRDGLGIAQRNDYGERKVFHSFRHSFITSSRRADNSVDKVQQVVGHEKTLSGQTDRYSHRYDLVDVLNVVDLVTYG